MTNLDLCKFINSFIERNIPDPRQRRANRLKYVALCIVLLYKVFGFGMDYCKEIIRLFCNRLIVYSLSSPTPGQLYEEIIASVTILDRAFDAGLHRQRVSGEERLKNALHSLADRTLFLTGFTAATPEDARMLQCIVQFIDETSRALSGVGQTENF